MDASFKTTSGADPARYILNLAGSIRPNSGDLLYAGQRQKTRIVERTLSGVDVDGKPFEPYSTNGPYYYYPNGRVGKTKATRKQNKAAVNRLLKKLSHVLENRSEYLGYEGVGGLKTRDGQGIRFESYADFKASLGRMGVDLTGPKAPHMLQAIEVRVTGDDEFAIGVYGEPAGRARGHNTGWNPRWKRRHQRRFMGASAQDLTDIVKDIWTRIKARMSK